MYQPTYMLSFIRLLKVTLIKHFQFKLGREDWTQQGLTSNAGMKMKGLSKVPKPRPYHYEGMLCTKYGYLVELRNIGNLLPFNIVIS